MNENHSGKLCSGCLSLDRRLEPLGEFFDLYHRLLEEATDNVNVMLCWECKALLRRTHLFQMRIQNAQIIPHRLPVKYLKINSLSYLSRTHTSIQSYSEEGVANTLEIPVIKENIDEKELNAEVNFFDVSLTIKNKEDTEKQNVENFFAVPIKEEDYNVSDNGGEDCLYEVYETDKDEVMQQVKNKKKQHNKSLNHIEYWRKEYKERVVIEEVLDLSKIEQYYKELMKRNVGVKDPDANIDYEDAKYKCNNCKLGFNSIYKLKCHRKNHHLKEKTKCCICSETFLSKQNVLRHIKDRHYLVLHCLNCNEKFTNLFHFRRHNSKYHKHFICDYCGVTKRSKNALVKHFRHGHGLLEKCSKCNKTMKSSRLSMHMKLVHAVCGAEDRERAYCVECDLQFQTLSKYKLHIKQSAKHNTSKTKKRSVCPDCGKEFSRTNYMRNHYKLVHVKQNKHYCQICDKYYINAYALRKHKDYVHDKVKMPKDKICEVCGRGFSSNRVLIHHMRTHTGERPHVCACGAAFAQRTALLTHARARHKCVPNDLNGNL